MKVNIQDAIHCVNVDLEETTCENCRLFGLDYSLCAEVDKIKLEALEKQIPKKPLFGTVHNDTAYYCSSCKNFIGFYDTRIYEYCHNCGQKLDWGE